LWTGGQLLLHGIWLVIELGQEIMPTNIFTKSDYYKMKTIEVIDLAETLYVVIRIVCNFDQDWYKTLVAGGQTDGSHPVIQKAHRDHCVQKCVNFFKATNLFASIHSPKMDFGRHLEVRY